MPNFRIPLLRETHEDEACTSQACQARFRHPKDIKILSKLAQRAQREATGYFCGYTFKRQPVGRRFLKAAADSLNYLSAGLENKSVGQKWHRITHRVLVDFQQMYGTPSRRGVELGIELARA